MNNLAAPADAPRQDSSPGSPEIQTIIDRLPSMIGYWDRQQRNRFGNHAYVDWFGIDPGQMRGRHIREVIGEERYRLNLPYIEAALRGEPQAFERAIPTPDGKLVRHAFANYVPDIQDGVVQGFFVLVTDITAVKEVEAVLRRSEERLRRSEERYRAVVEDQTEIISRLRGDGTYIFANEVFCRFFGRSEKEIIGSNWHPLVHAEDKERVAQELCALAPDHPVVTIENRVYSATGQLHWMQFANRGFFDAEGRLIEIQSVGRDVTDRKEAELALRNAHRELERRVQQLRQLAVHATLAEERERQAIAHDLHDDLGQVLHVAKLKIDALTKVVPASAAPLAGELNALLADASRMVRSLTAQLSPPVLKDLGLIAALRWLAEEMDRLFGLAVETVDGCGAVQVGPAQSAIVFRTVRELLFNVAKHAGVDQARLDIRCDGDRLVVTVADQGRGIADIEATLVSRHGHGLASVRERIGFLGGSMAVSSVPGLGTAVTLQMPLLQADAATEPAA